MDFRAAWGQGDHTITLAITIPCPVCGEKGQWIQDPQYKSKNKRRFQCTRRKCRSELRVWIAQNGSLKTKFIPHLHQGKPLPADPESIRFYEKFTRSEAMRIVDMFAGTAAECYCCRKRMDLSGGLRVITLRYGPKQMRASVCEFCRAELKTKYLMVCNNCDTRWYVSRREYREKHPRLFFVPEQRKAMEATDILTEKKCEDCNIKDELEELERIGWKLD